MYYDLRDSFLDAARQLPNETGKKLWKSVSIISRDSAAPGLNLEKLAGKASPLWSFRVDQKYRANLYRDENITTLLFVGVEQDAYRFAEKTPKTGNDIGLRQRAPQGDSAKALPLPAVKEDQSGSISRTAKYVPLARYLLNAGPSKRNVTMGFSEIEKLIGATLPNSARRHRAWWGNDTSSHVQASAWLSAGWRVVVLDFPKESVTFERENATV